MRRTYKYRLYPNKTQAEMLDFLLWQGRKIYNGALDMRIKHYEATGETISTYTLRDHWCAQRKEETDTFGLLPFATVDDLIRRLDKAYAAFFRRVKNGDEPGFPRFKGRWRFNSLGYRAGSGIKFIPGREWAKLRITYVGHVRVRQHRPLPSDAKIKMVIVKRERRDRWYACLQCELPDSEPAQHPGPAVGIDIGMVYLLALSDGTTIDNPRWYREGKATRRILERKLDRQRRANNPQNYNEDGTVKDGVFIWHKSTRMKETERRLRKLHDETAQKRWYFWHTTTDWLTRTYSLIAIEDLSLDFMIQNKQLAMSAHDAAFSEFWKMLDYKAAERGVEVVRVPAAYTSQTCAACGYVDSENRKTQATFKCVSCGHAANADVNAAEVILQRAVPARRGVTQPIGANVPCEAHITDGLAAR